MDETLASPRRPRGGDGAGPFDLVLAGGTVVDVAAGRLVRADVAVRGGRIAAVGTGLEGREVVDCAGRYVAPGFIDGHVHVESSMLCVREFARAVLPRGTTTVVADPHEVANVLGSYGVELVLAEARSTPLSVLVTVPSCVPATALETSGASIGPEEVERLMGLERVVGLGELMDYPGAIARRPDVVAKVAAARRAGKVVDGHAPRLTGPGLDAYIAAGAMSDHESSSGPEALEKLSKGMHLMVREGSAARNMAAVLPDLVRGGADWRRVSLVTDDRHPRDLLEEGHLDHAVRRAVGLGLDPLTAVGLVTRSTARYFGLADRGSVEPGMRADLVVLSSLELFEVEEVYVAGRLAARGGACTASFGPFRYQERELRSVRLGRSYSAGDFAIPLDAPSAVARVIGVADGSLVTASERHAVAPRGGAVPIDTGRDLLKLAVAERHRGSGGHATALVRGFGLGEGALASTVAHDSHNAVTVGADEADMAAAVNALGVRGGGLVAVRAGRVVAALDLPVAGLMSTLGAREVADGLERLHEAARDMGCPLRSPFMTLSFLALPVIPALKLTDRGLVEDFRFVPVVEGAAAPGDSARTRP